MDFIERINGIPLEDWISICNSKQDIEIALVMLLHILGNDPTCGFQSAHYARHAEHVSSRWIRAGFHTQAQVFYSDFINLDPITKGYCIIK